MHLPKSASDEDLIGFVDQWAALMEKEDYGRAYAFTSQRRGNGWSPEAIRIVVKSDGEADPSQKVTVQGKPTDVRQRKEVTRWNRNSLGEVGEIWYDLNIDGYASDLTATFSVSEVADRYEIALNDIHVM